MRIFDLEDLHIFLTTAREGGVVRAAVRLNRVPSNITTRIKQLEQRLGVQLFRRQGRGLALTDAGKTLLTHAERLLRLADEAEREVCGLGMRGVLKIGSLESAAGARLPPVLARFNSEYPEITLELKTGTTDSLLRQLEAYEIEAALVSEPFEKGNLNSLRVFEETLVIISSASCQAITHPGDLQDKTVFAFPQGCSYRRRMGEWLADAGVSPHRFLDVASYHAIVACVAAGAGVAIVPESVLETVVMSHTVKRHPLPASVGANATHLVWQGEASPQLVTLISLLPNGNCN